MTYQSSKVGIIVLTEEERQEKMEAVREALKKAGEELVKSPCIYRGAKYWWDCRKCNGFMKGCPARTPEAIVA